MLSGLVEEKSNRVLLKQSEYHGFSEVYIFEEKANYLICKKCYSCIKSNLKMIKFIDAHKASCKFYPKKASTLDVHKLCLRKGFTMTCLFF